MKVMADGASSETGDIPRAPPPSPELPHHQVQPFNFAELLTITSLQGNSPTSSTEHSRPTSPLFYPSPEHAHPQSGSVSPLEKADSPYSFSSKLSELRLTPSSYHESNSGFGESFGQMNSSLGKQLICGSLPVNGEMHAYIHQQELNYGSDFSHFLNSDGPTENCNVGERRRKISLKRQHDNQEEYFYDARADAHEIINKKLCHGNDRVGSAPSHTRRSHTFSGSLNSGPVNRHHGSTSGDPLRLSEGTKSFQVGSLPGGHLTNGFTDEPHSRPSSDCLSPGGLKTVGFSTSGIPPPNADEQMEGVEMEGGGEGEVPPISVTQMDWSSGGISLSSNVTPANFPPQNSMSGFSFALPSSSSTGYTPPSSSSLSFHLNVPGFASDSVPTGGYFSSQRDHNGQIPLITLTPHNFSKSL